MAELGWNKAQESQRPTVIPVHNGADHIDWFGEVSELRTDGLIEVTLPNLSKVLVPLERLTLLQDGLDATAEDMWGDEYDDEDGEGSFIEDGEGDEMEIEYEDPQDADGASQASWETVPEEERANDWADEPDEPDNDALPESEDVRMDTQSSSLPAEVSNLPAPAAPPTAPTPELRTPSPVASGSRQSTRAAIFEADDTDEAWQRFAVLSSAPADHAYYGTPVAQPNKAFTSRLAKEFRVLSQNLPGTPFLTHTDYCKGLTGCIETILVRAYEDRSDLLRSLIIGPENTPYADAPFVIDWMLDGDFPQTPPKAHFLSWTNGNGRVNP